MSMMVLESFIENTKYLTNDLKEWERDLPAYLEERAFQTEKQAVKGSNMRVCLASFRAAKKIKRLVKVKEGIRL